MRICSTCGGELKQGWGWDKDASERAGNPKAVDEFTCLGCGLIYLHSYEERFSGDIEGWAVKDSPDDTWRHLPQKQWPRSDYSRHRTEAQPGSTRRTPPARPPEAPAPQREPAPEYEWDFDAVDRAHAVPAQGSDGSIVYIPHFNNQAVLVFDRETGLHEEISKDQHGNAGFWKGFYLPGGRELVGFHASVRGPVMFAGGRQFLAVPGRTKALIDEGGTRREFTLMHDGAEVLRLSYTPLPTGFDAWSEDESFVDFYRYLEERLDDPDWYTYNTLAEGEDPSWKDAPPEPEPGPHFGEYLFVWNRETDEFLERIRVLHGGQSHDDIPEADRQTWTGYVPLPRLGELKQRFDRKYGPPHLVLTSHGNDCRHAMWSFRRIFKP